jgi:L-2,4-diaminobutyrate decarboxylase
MTERKHYAEILEGLKQCFPAPTSNPVMDGYFVYTVAHFLDQVDHLKGAAPLLGSDMPNSIGDGLERFPEGMSSVEAVVERLVDYCRGMIVWSHPNFQAQVVPPPTVPSITAVVAAAIYNPNIVEDAASMRFAEAERQVVTQISELIGFDPARSGGLFTFGGTGTILYGCKLAIERLSGGRAMRDGLREDLKIVTSDAAHYTRLNVAGWLGLGTRNIVSLPTTRDNEMSLTHLEAYLRGAFER